jgi:hypothetical protein
MDDPTPSRFEQHAREQRASGLISETGRFLWQTKKWWMVPIIIVMVLLSVLIYLAGSAAAPFIYTLF